MGSASGVYKQPAYKKESTFGVLAGAAGAQAMRRTSVDIGLKKDTYGSAEIRGDMQKADFRHGVRRVSGKISSDLSPKTSADFFGSFCKRLFTACPSVTGASITIAGSGPYTLTRAAGSWLTDNIKVGHVGRLTAGTFNVANSNKNLFVAGVTATVLTVTVPNGSALVAEGPIASATFAVTGKQTFIPTSGHLEESYTIEQWFPETPSSEAFTGCKISGFTANLPPTGVATIDFDVMGKDIATQASQYFTAATAATTTGSLAAVNGVIRAAGSVVAILTGLSIQGNANYTGDPVAGSNSIPQLFPGIVEVSGQLTGYFDSVALRDAFLNETEIDLAGVFTSDNSATADFVSFILPRIKLGDHAKSDGQGAIVATMPFTALLNVAGGAGTATEKTTLLIQDSAA
jgi:hypothetical protein